MRRNDRATPSIAPRSMSFQVVDAPTFANIAREEPRHLVPRSPEKKGITSGVPGEGGPENRVSVSVSPISKGMASSLRHQSSTRPQSLIAEPTSVRRWSTRYAHSPEGRAGMSVSRS